MLNETYLTEAIDYPYANQYRQYIMDFYNNIDEKIEIIETYITEFTERGQKDTPASLQVASITEQKENILQNIRIFKVRASTVQTESQWTVLLEEYQRMMKKLSSYIQTVEELV
jgi:hypothetical protein